MIKIEKRNGEVVGYDGSKVINVIVRAMKEGETGVNLEIAKDIEQDIFEILSKQNQDVSVERISDLIETKLMEYGRYNTAKRFILFRNKKTEDRKKQLPHKYKHLSEEFLSKYRKLDEPFPTHWEVLCITGHTQDIFPNSEEEKSGLKLLQEL